MRIRTKLTLSVLAISLVVLTLSMGTIYLNSKATAEEAALNLAVTIARENASEVEKIFDEVVYVATDLEVVFKALLNSGDMNTKTISSTFSYLLESHSNIYSIGVVSDPNNTIGTDFDYIDQGYSSLLVTQTEQETSAFLTSESETIDLTQVLSNKKPILSEAMTYTIEGAQVKLISYLFPMSYDGQNTFLIRVDLPVSVLQEITEKITIFESGFARILSHEGIVVTHKDSTRVGDIAGELKDTDTVVIENVGTALKDGLEYNTFSYSVATDSTVFKSLTPIHILTVDTPWSFGTIVTKNDMYKSVYDITNIILLSIVVSIIAIIVAMLFVSRIITKPIENAKKHAQVISELDFTQSLPAKYVSKKDETGEMLRAFNKLQQNIKALVENIHKSSGEVTHSADELKTITSQFSRATEEITETIGQLAQSASEMASNTEDGAKKANQLGLSIEIVNEKIGDMQEIVNKVYDIVEDGNKTVNELIDINNQNNVAATLVYQGIHDTNDSVENIARSSEQIAQIADQTNLLALNAAIESARAGEAGKGFSVVADEIRKLAEESRKLTTEISNVINNLRNQSEKSVESIDTVTKTNMRQKASVELTKERFNGIQTETKEIYEAIGVLFAAGKDVTNMKNEIVDIINNLSALSEENAASTQETSATTEEQSASLFEIENQAVSLHDQSVSLDLEINKFKF